MPLKMSATRGLSPERAGVSRSRAVAGSVVPAVGRACPADEAADGVGEVEERVDDGGSTLVAGKALEGVLPGVGALHMPPVACLDRCLLALVRDPAVQAALGKQGTGVGTVVAGIEVHGDVVGQGRRSSSKSRGAASNGAKPPEGGLRPLQYRPARAPEPTRRPGGSRVRTGLLREDQHSRGAGTADSSRGTKPGVRGRTGETPPGVGTGPGQPGPDSRAPDGTASDASLRGPSSRRYLLRPVGCHVRRRVHPRPTQRRRSRDGAG